MLFFGIVFVLYDAICYVKTNKDEFVLEKLNCFHKNIQFTYELEEEKKSSFSDVLLSKSGNSIETMVYRKPKNNIIYLNWKSLAPGT